MGASGGGAAALLTLTLDPGNALDPTLCSQDLETLANLIKEARCKEAMVDLSGLRPRHPAQVVTWPDEVIDFVENDPGSRVVEL